MKLRALWLQIPLLVLVFGCVPAAVAADVSAAAAQPADAGPKIPGHVITRANGTFLGLQIDDSGNFKLSFYDAQKKPVAPDVTGATLRWTPKGKLGIENFVLSPGADGLSLTSPRVVGKPWAFKLYLSLFAGGGDTASELYNFDFSQSDS